MSNLVEKEIDLSKIKLAIGTPIFGNPYYPYMESLWKTRTVLESLGINHQLMFDINNPYIDLARNRICQQFMDSDCDRIMWIDHDMGWEEQDVINLLYWSTRHPFVAGVYPIKKEPLTYKLQMTVPLSKNSQGLIKAQAVPIGFTIIHKAVFNSMKPAVFEHEDVELKQYFKAGLELKDNKKTFIGEDIFFCEQYGGDIWIDPEVNPTHYGGKGYSGNFATLAEKKFGVKDSSINER